VSEESKRKVEIDGAEEEAVGLPALADDAEEEAVGLPALADDAEGLEALAEEAEGGALTPSAELEEALREASEAVEGRKAEGLRAADPKLTADKMTIEILSGELQTLKAEYEALQGELEQSNERYVRLQAEFENFRRRGLKERQEAHSFGHQNLVKDLLSTVDNLDRALGHAEQNTGDDLQALLQGVELVSRELLVALGKHGVIRIDAQDQPFDPAIHEAMAQVESSDAPPNTVLQVLQTGYMLRDRMLRPARVVVSKAPK
jgi:molecular chaperone GrpE